MNLNMKNIKKFILEKLKVTPNARQYDLPTWKEFTDALYNFTEQECCFILSVEDLSKH